MGLGLYKYRYLYVDIGGRFIYFNELLRRFVFGIISLRII